MTLCFLAYQPERDIERIAEVMRAVERAAGEVALRSGAGCGSAEPPPPVRGRRARARPRSSSQAELSDRLEAERFYKPEKRPFWPHVTVARVQAREAHRLGAPGAPRGRPMRVERRPEPLPAELLEPFGAPRVTLYRSSCGRRAPSTCRWPRSTCRPTGRLT